MENLEQWSSNLHQYQDNQNLCTSDLSHYLQSLIQKSKSLKVLVKVLLILCPMFLWGNWFNPLLSWEPWHCLPGHPYRTPFSTNKKKLSHWLRLKAYLQQSVSLGLTGRTEMLQDSGIATLAMTSLPEFLTNPFLVAGMILVFSFLEKKCFIGYLCLIQKQLPSSQFFIKLFLCPLSSVTWENDIQFKHICDLVCLAHCISA